MSQVKFYKGMSNSNAAGGLKSDGQTAVSDGGILFSEELYIDNPSGTPDEYSGRIYTKDSSKGVIEYYKGDLEFASTKTLATDFGLKKAGEDINQGTRIIDLLNSILFKTYLPKYTPASLGLSVSGTPQVKGSEQQSSYSNLSVTNGESYVEIGSTVKVSSPTIVINGTVASSLAQIGNKSYSAEGGQFQSGTIGLNENGTSLSNVSGLQMSLSTVDYPDYVKVGDSVEITSVGESTVNYLKSYPHISMTFATGTTIEGNTNKSKDSDGQLTNRFASDLTTADTGSNGDTSYNYSTQGGSITTCVNSSYNINSVTLGGNVPEKSFKVKGYYTIYYQETIKYKDGTYKNGVLGVYSEKQSSITSSQSTAEGKIDSTNSSSDTLTRTITGSQAYILENIQNNSSSYLIFCGPRLTAGDTTGYRFILPNEYSIDEMYAHDLKGVFGDNLIGKGWSVTKSGNTWSIKCSQLPMGAQVYQIKIKRVIPSNNN